MFQSNVKKIAKCNSNKIKFLDYLNNDKKTIECFEALENGEIVVAYSDGSIKIYDIKSEKCLKSFCLQGNYYFYLLGYKEHSYFQGNIEQLIFLDKNEIICNTGCEITIWDKDTCKCKTKIKAQESNSFNHFIVENCNIYCQESDDDKDYNISIWDKQSGALSKQIPFCCEEYCVSLLSAIWIK